MAQYSLAHHQKNVSFSAQNQPLLHIQSGDEVSFETADLAYERLSKGESVETIGLENFNAITGAVWIEGAEIGDVIEVEVLDIQLRRAWSVWLPNFGGYGHLTTEIKVKEIPLLDGKAWVSSRLAVSVVPMIGCIGVAPAQGEGSTFMPAYPFGGNMDLRELSIGAKIWLPVHVAGALLSMGDLHAAMGQGEPTWVSLEAAGTAYLRINLLKNKDLKMPRIFSGNKVMCLGMGETLEEAHQHAMNDAFEVLTNEFGLEKFEAYAFASATLEMRLGGPACSMVLASFPIPEIIS